MELRKAELVCKIAGNKEDIQKFVNLLEEYYEFLRTSPYIPNSDGPGYHIFLDLKSKSGGIE